MIAVLLAASGAEPAIWQEEDIHRERERLILSVSRCSDFETVHLVTDDQLVCDAFAGSDIITHHVPPACNGIMSCNGLVPHEIMPAIMQSVTEDADVAFFNCANLLAGANLLQRAIQEYQATHPPVLVSVQEVEDHPCQRFTLNEAVERGLCVPVAEKSAGLAGPTVSIPFSFPWGTLGVTTMEPGTPVSLEAGRLALHVATGDGKARGPRWIFESADKARALLPDGLAARGDTIAFDPVAAEGKALCRYNPDTSRLVFDYSAMALKKEPVGVLVSAVTPEGEFGHTVLSDTRTEHCAFERDLPYCEVSGRILAYILLRPWGNKQALCYEMKYYFNDLWCVDEMGCLVNTLTGSFITGRQAFPAVFELADTVMVTRTDVLSRFAVVGHDLPDDSKGLVIGKAESLTLATRFDVLLYKALLRSEYGRAVHREVLA